MHNWQANHMGIQLQVPTYKMFKSDTCSWTPTWLHWLHDKYEQGEPIMIKKFLIDVIIRINNNNKNNNNNNKLHNSLFKKIMLWQTWP